MEFTEVLNNRFSCKKYDSKQISAEQLTAILEAGRLAPTAKNMQPQRIYVIQSPEGLAKVDAVSPCRYNAPTVLAIAFDKNFQYSYPGGKYLSGPEDVTIVATYMMLAAQSVGVNSCWLNCFDPDAMAKSMGLPENEQLVMLLDLGYAAPDGKPLANHFSRKEISETVKYL